MDKISKQHRSWNMSRIRGMNTKPEMSVRKFIFAQGIRYRVNDRGLWGKPDISIKKYKIAVFVHGCFWHRHGCKKAAMPKSNKKFWKSKFEKNVQRDREVRKKFNQDKWTIFVIWECKLEKNQQKELLRLSEKLKKTIKIHECNNSSPRLN